MRSNPAMLYPLFALAAWTFVVLVLIPLARVRSVRLREIGADDFKDGESAKVPGHVGVPNRNDMNLLELSMLFYVVGIVLYVSGGASYVAMFFAWAYVALQLEMQRAALAILGKGLAPVHRRAVANARRLAKKKR